MNNEKVLNILSIEDTPLSQGETLEDLRATYFNETDEIKKRETKVIIDTASAGLALFSKDINDLEEMLEPKETGEPQKGNRL